METVYVLRIAKPRKDGTDRVTHKLVEDPQDAALVVERRSRRADDESYALFRFEGDRAETVQVPGVSYSETEGSAVRGEVDVLVYPEGGPHRRVQVFVDEREVQYIQRSDFRYEHEDLGAFPKGERHAVLVLRDGGARLVVALSYERLKLAGLGSYLRA